MDEAIFYYIGFEEAVERWKADKPVLKIYDDGTEAYAESLKDIIEHHENFGEFAYEEEES